MGKKSSTSQPAAPNPKAIADAQTETNRNAIYDSALLNRYDQTNPYGSVTWDRSADPSDPSKWSQNVSFSPEYQQRFDNENQLADSIGQSAISATGNLPGDRFNTSGLPELQPGLDREGLPNIRSGLDTSTLQALPTDYSADAKQVEDATYQRALGLLNPEFDRQERQLDSRLASQGLPMGGEAYDGEKDRFQRSRNEANLAAAYNAVGAGRNEQSRLFDINQRARQQGVGEQATDADLAARARQQNVAEQGQDFSMTQGARQQGIADRQLERNQAYNELAQLTGTTPGMTTVNAPATAQYQIAPSDRIGAEQLAYQGRLNNYNAGQNQNAQKKGGAVDLTSTVLPLVFG